MPHKGQYRTHCKQGHKFTEENTYITPGLQQVCRVCRRKSAHRYSATAKGKYAYLVFQDKARDRIKLEVLSHYGKGGKAQCCWRGCTVTDIDMLSLDHINNDGSEHTDLRGVRLLGTHLYRWAKRNKYPEVLQTMCFNHQHKKETVRRRNIRIKNRERDAKRIGGN